MRDFPPLLLLVVFVAVAIVVAVLVHLSAKKRRDALAALAAELGFSFEPADDDAHDEQFAQFEVFRRGGRRRAYNTLEGSATIDGRAFPCRMGDFRYTVKSGKNSHTHRFSYLILRLPFPRVPSLLIRRENLFDKFAGAIGFDDIDFESVEFSRRFHVKSGDKRFAFDVVHPKMMDFLMSTNAPVIDIEHGSICVIDGTRRWEPEEFKARLGWAGSFFDLWPDHLTRQLDS
jgi:hypothetical protein